MAAITLVVCAAPLARRIGDIASAFLEEGWSVSVVATPSAVSWIDVEDLTVRIGEPLRVEYRQVGQAKSQGDPAAVVVCPATFNTVNKIAAGVADNYAVSLVSESVGAGTPLLIAPMVNVKLSNHFAWAGSIESLAKSGARFLDIQSGTRKVGAVDSGLGDVVVESFRPAWLTAAVREMLGAQA